AIPGAVEPVGARRQRDEREGGGGERKLQHHGGDLGRDDPEQDKRFAAGVSPALRAGGGSRAGGGLAPRAAAIGDDAQPRPLALRRLAAHWRDHAEEAA